MPLRAGRDQATISDNIAELMRAYERTGKIGRVTPRNKEHARKIAEAVAYAHARRSG